MGQGWDGVGAQGLRAEGDSTGKWGPQENGSQKSNDPSVYWWMNRRQDESCLQEDAPELLQSDLALRDGKTNSIVKYTIQESEA